MRTLPFILLFLSLNTFYLRGQNNDTLSGIDLKVISQVNHGSSYITFPTDIGNIDKLWFEGDLIPNFYIRTNNKGRFMAVFTPEIIIRMYREKSSPVRTPSYKPQINFYYMIAGYEDTQNINLFGRIAHHSNGQDGNFLEPNGKINLITGDFSTNFFEIGIIKTNINRRFNAYQFFKTSIEIHPKGWDNYQLDNIYSKYRWHSAASIFKLPHNFNGEKNNNADISIKAELTYMFGNVNNWNLLSQNRINLSLIFYYHPKFLEDVGLFIQYYSGLDFYNIYFNHKLNILRFGIMTEKLRF